MSHGLPVYQDNQDPQNQPLDRDDYGFDMFDDPDAQAEAREEARQHHLDWLAEHVG